MKAEIIAGIFALGGVVIGALINGLFQYLKTRRERTKKELLSLCEQMISFCALEEKYIAEILTLRGEKGIESKEKGIKNEFRHLIYLEDHERITYNIPHLNALKEQYK